MCKMQCCIYNYVKCSVAYIIKKQNLSETGDWHPKTLDLPVNKEASGRESV
jgi:hypothetical protein